MLKAVIGLALAGVFTAPLRAQSPVTRPNFLARLPVPVQYVRVFGQRLAYYEAGPAAARTVVLIPSLGWDSHAWAQNFAHLAQTFHVIAVDPLGLGLSDKPLIDYKMETWTDSFAELLRLKGIPRAAFVGAVMGGALAVQMAMDYPDRVSAIVVAASNSGPGAHEGGPRGPPAYAPSLAGTRANLLDSFYDSALVTDAVVRARLAYRLGAGDGYTVQRHLSDHRVPYTPAELARVTVPALFVWCREDRITPPSWGEDFARALPRGKLVVLDRCGHFPNIEQPGAFNRAVAEFLTAIAGRSASARPAL
jgi:2-hydroxy-6-oxonona-2,4-dienedioate hydrolase